MSTDCIIKCSSANKCTKMNVVTFCHITWSMHLINLLLHHIIIQLLCPNAGMTMSLNAYVIWQWAQHVCTWLYDTLQQARPGSLKCDKACSAQAHMHTQPWMYPSWQAHQITWLSGYLSHPLPAPPTTYACIMYLTAYIAVCCRQCMHSQHTHVYTS